MNAVISKSKKLKEGFEYIKDADTLRCPAGHLAIDKTYMISLMSDIHKEQQEFQETEHFKQKLRYERYKIEAKNNELKAVHGLCKAKSIGLSMMRVQTYLTCITANIKRMMKLMEQQLA